MPLLDNKTRPMPLLTLDPNKPPTRSPHKRATPPQSPPTPHKIELIEDDHRRLLRSSISSDNGVSRLSSTRSEEGSCVGTNIAKKKLFTKGDHYNGGVQNNHVVIKQRTRPRKTEETKNSVKSEKGPKKKLSFVESDKSTTNNSVKAFMPIRRSERRPKKKAADQTADIIQRLSEVGPDDSKLPLKIVTFPGKNRGVVPTKKLTKGEFVIEYAGELIEHSTAEERENRYAMDISKGCYMYYFKTNGKHYCIDATAETGRLGRLVNHSRLQPNCCTKVVMVDKIPRLVLIAKKDIESGTELLYDYHDRSEEHTLNSSHDQISYAVFCLKKKKQINKQKKKKNKHTST